jgi:transcriptional regulator with XRE-family HTH domain
MGFRTELRRRRRATGLSQQDLADLVHYDRSLISMVETGRTPPSNAFAVRCDHALHAGGELVRLAAADGGVRHVPGPRLCQDAWDRTDTEALSALFADDTVTIDQQTARRVAHEWLVSEPPQVVELRSGRRIGDSMIATIRTRTAELRRMDDHLGGNDLLQTVVAELAATTAVARDASYSEEIGRKLLAAIGDLAQIAGWVAADAGENDLAARCYVGGAQAAHAAGDRALAATLLSMLSYLTASVGDPSEAVLLARTAHVGARGTTPAVRILVAERVAWAHAVAGDTSRCERALGEVDDLFADVRLSDEPDWAYWLTRDEIDIMAGRCYTELRRPMRAVPLLDTALAGYGTGNPRESALYSTWLADSYVQAGEIEQAAEVACHALGLATAVNSARSRHRVDLVRARLRPYRYAPAVREFEERYRAAIRTVDA